MAKDKKQIKEKPFSNLSDRWDGLGSVGEPHGVSVTAVHDDLTAADIAQVRVGMDSDPPERQTVVSP